MVIDQYLYKLEPWHEYHMKKKTFSYKKYFGLNQKVMKLSMSMYMELVFPCVTVYLLHAQSTCI